MSFQFCFVVYFLSSINKTIIFAMYLHFSNNKFATLIVFFLSSAVIMVYDNMIEYSPTFVFVLFCFYLRGEGGVNDYVLILKFRRW